MSDKRHLYVLWTSADLITAENMVFMYATNSIIHGWWEKVTLIIWGASTKLTAQNDNIQKLIHDAQVAGVHITACKACADQMGVVSELKKLNIEIKYWGVPLTDLLKNKANLLTI